MPDLTVPPNVSSITFATSGIKAVASRKITGITAQEFGELLKYERQPTVAKTAANGDVDFWMRDGQITSITINAVVYPVTAGMITAVPAVQASIFLRSDNNITFNRG